MMEKKSMEKMKPAASQAIVKSVAATKPDGGHNLIQLLQKGNSSAVNRRGHSRIWWL